MSAFIAPEAVLYDVPAPDGGAPLRHIRHPGPANTAVDVVPCQVRPRRLQGLRTGVSLLQALTEALAAQGVDSAVLRLDASAALQLDPYPYVLPSLSRDPAHAVYFSERHQASGLVQVQAGTITFGVHNGQPWLHGHLDWTELGTDGSRRGCGHVLPDQAQVVGLVGPIDAWALDGARFEVVPDAFTAFSLFKPQPCNGGLKGAAGRSALAVRVPPNVDLCTALEALCRERGISGATLLGGVGSTVGVAFDDGRVVEPFVTETLVRQGRIATDAAGQPRAEIDVTLIDYLGGRHQGRLARGRNPVLVTFELVLAIDDIR